MNAKSNLTIFRLLSLVLVLALSLALARPAYAEGELPPTEPTLTEGTPPLTEGDPAAEQPPAEGLSSDTEGLSSDMEDEAPAPDLGEVVDTLAENELTLTNAEGEEVPLSSPEAVELLTADPWFSVSGVTYRFFPNAAGCDAFPGEQGVTCFDSDTAPSGGFTPSGNAMQDVIEFINIKGIIPTDKMIYVDGTGNNNQDLILDGSRANLGALAGIIGTGPDTTKFSATNFKIQNLAGGFLVKGILFQNEDESGTVLEFENIGGTIKIENVVLTSNNSADGGIKISNARGAVEIRETRLEFTGGDGINIDNTAGTGNVTLTNVSAIYGYGDGIEINTRGTVLLNGVNSSQNFYNAGGYGATITSQKGLTVKNSVFDNNEYTGLYLSDASLGAVTIENVYARNNDQTGIDLSTRGGAVKLNNVTAVENDWYGVYVDSCLLGSGSICANTITSPFTITNTILENNDSGNLVVYANGAITISVVTADNSFYGTGMILDNHYARSAAAVTITRGQAISNNLNNIDIFSKGAVMLDAVLATGSDTSTGVRINNSYGSGTVSILSKSGKNDLTSNYEKSLDILSKGAVTIGWIDAGNSGGGAIINTIGAVTITGKSAAEVSEFDSNENNGLEIKTAGNITLTNVSAEYNSGVGFLLHNPDKTGAVKITNATADYNAEDGFWIVTQGAVTMTTVQANSNYKGGANIDNRSAKLQGVTITGGTFNSNQYTGLQILSSGTVSATKITAHDNDYANVYTNDARAVLEYGDYFADYLNSTNYWRFLNDNSQATKLTLICDSYCSIYMTDPSGTPVVDESAVENPVSGKYEFNFSGTLTQVGYYRFQISGGSDQYEIALENPANLVDFGNESSYPEQVYGVQVDNSTGSGAVTVSGVPGQANGFSQNMLDGIYIYTKGVVKVQDGAGYRNGRHFVQVINTAGVGKGVTLANLSTYQNRSTGIIIESTGTVAVNGSSSYQNDGGNLTISTQGAVSVIGTKGVSTFGSTDVGHGVIIYTNGNVTLANFSASDNEGGWGVHVDNHTGTGSVTVSDVVATSNGFDGLYIRSYGAITLKNITANYNGKTGIDLDNNAGYLKGITATNLYLEGNVYEALLVTGAGSITISGLTVRYAPADTIGHDSYVVYINAMPGLGTVSLSNFVLDSNTASEWLLRVDSRGQVNLTSIHMQGNSNGGGLFVDNTSSPTPKPIVAKGLESSSIQGGDAFYLVSGGDVSVTNVKANSTGNGTGLYISNLSSSNPLAKVTINTSGTFTNQFNNNRDYGLYIESEGNIAVSNSQAVSNNSNSSTTGMYLDNAFGAGSISLVNVYFWNDRNHATVRSHGSILVDRVTATNATAFGINLLVADNQNKPVNVYRSTFSYNTGYGLNITTSGIVTLNGVTASGNYSGTAYGIQVTNNGGSSIQPVNVLSSYGANSFSANYGWGLKITSGGKVSISKVSMVENYYAGLIVNTSSPLGVVVTDATLKETYYGPGADIVSTGPVVITRLIAMLNGKNGSGNGLTVTTTNANVTIKDSALTGNMTYGIETTIGSGVLFLSNTTYFGNYSANIYKN